MDTHQFQKSVKVQRFCLTLVGEARLWYESLRPINIDWQGLQNQFRQQYSKIGNMREQLFHVWWSFHFDEITEMLDAYITCMRQVATYLWEPQILEVFKNTLPTKLYWVLFPMHDLTQAEETAKIILTKERIDRQLIEESSSIPFMSIKDSYKNKKVTFDTWDGLEDKIDRITVMMGKLTMKDNRINKQFKPQIYQSKSRGQSINFYDKCNYDRRNYQNRYRSNSIDRRIQYRQNKGRCRYKQNYRNDYRKGNFRGNMRMYQNFGRQNNRGGYRRNYRNEIIKEKEVGLEKDHIQTIIAEGETGVVVIVDQGQDQEQVHKR